MSEYRLLIVDDEKLIVKGIKLALEQEKMHVDVAYDGEDALSMIEDMDYDLVVLDVMLPGLGGLEVCQQIRDTSPVPIIMLTAKGDDIDKITGLELGADDYLTKPFNIIELKARIKAILRRSVRNSASEVPVNEGTVELGELYLDSNSRRVYLNDDEVNLTAKEFDLLDLMIKNIGKVYNRETLLNLVWGYDYHGDARTVDVHVRRLREKLEKNPSDPRYLHTKWGVGYYLQ